MKVTIFGATGFSGQAILADSIKQGHEVTILVRDASKIPIKHQNLTIVEGNVLNPQQLLPFCTIKWRLSNAWELVVKETANQPHLFPMQRKSLSMKCRIKKSNV